MKNHLENEVNEKKIKSYNTTTGSNSRPIGNVGAAYHWAMWPVGETESGVKLQYKLAQTRPVNIARMSDDPTSVVGMIDYTSVDSCFWKGWL